MIKGALADEINLSALPKKLGVLLTYLKQSDLNSVSEGVTPLENGVSLISSSYFTKMRHETTLVEGHRKYIDIQIVVVGSEAIGVLPINDVDYKNEYNDKSDVWTAIVKTKDINKFVELESREFLILFPEDAHAPQYAVDNNPTPVNKIVVKVPIV
ncbi:MAG: YhcH/YjgK/YiaL family protein [Anaerolineaceae bacterium]